MALKVSELIKHQTALRSFYTSLLNREATARYRSPEKISIEIKMALVFAEKGVYQLF